VFSGLGGVERGSRLSVSPELLAGAREVVDWLTDEVAVSGELS
jgi:hypothetical protein